LGLAASKAPALQIDSKKLPSVKIGNKAFVAVHQQAIATQQVNITSGIRITKLAATGSADGFDANSMIGSVHNELVRY
jgi:hypothetical protein